jgi:hypothetical protein
MRISYKISDIDFQVVLANPEKQPIVLGGHINGMVISVIGTKEHESIIDTHMKALIASCVLELEMKSDISLSGALLGHTYHIKGEDSQFLAMRALMGVTTLDAINGLMYQLRGLDPKEVMPK